MVGKGFRVREVAQVGGELALQEAPEVEGAAVGAVGRGQRQKAVRVHRLELDVEPARRRLDHPRQEEARELVGHHHRGVARQGGQQAPTGVARGLDVRVVADAGAGECAGVVGHPVENKAVDAVAGPGIVHAQRLEYQQRFAQLARPLERPIEAEVPRRAPGGDHPVEDEVAVAAHRGVVLGQDAELGDHRSSFARK